MNSSKEDAFTARWTRDADSGWVASRLICNRSDLSDKTNVLLHVFILSYQVHVYSHPDSLLSFKEPLRVSDTPGSLSTLSYVSTCVYLIKCCYITSGASRIYQRGGANPKELGQTYYLVKICRKLHEMQWRI